MSNAYQDWMNDGGACGDCTYNVFLGSDATCAQDMSLHKKETCRFFKDQKSKAKGEAEERNNYENYM